MLLLSQHALGNQQRACSGISQRVSVMRGVCVTVAPACLVLPSQGVFPPVPKRKAERISGMWVLCIRVCNLHAYVWQCMLVRQNMQAYICMCVSSRARCLHNLSYPLTPSLANWQYVILLRLAAMETVPRMGGGGGGGGVEGWEE